MNFFSVGKDIDIMANDEKNLEVLRYSSGADSTPVTYTHLTMTTNA